MRIASEVNAVIDRIIGVVQQRFPARHKHSAQIRNVRTHDFAIKVDHCVVTEYGGERLGFDWLKIDAVVLDDGNILSQPDTIPAILESCAMIFKSRRWLWLLLRQAICRAV